MATDIKLNLKLESGNEAFQDGNHRAEIGRLLRLLADGIENGSEGRFHLYDIYGNCVGAAMLEVWGDDE